MFIVIYWFFVMVCGIVICMFVVMILFVDCEVWYGVIIVYIMCFCGVDVVEDDFNICCVDLFL